jgi:hypothetical protein
MGEQTLTLYSRAHCHLCDEMLGALRSLQGPGRFEVEVVDVDGDAALRQRYGEDVPVLVHDGRELCRHRLDAETVVGYLAKIA